MQILRGLILGGVVGLAVHFALPHRDTRGAALAPLAAAAAASVSWTVVTWAGFGVGSVVPWIVAILASGATALTLVPALSRARLRSDEATRRRHGI